MSLEDEEQGASRWAGGRGRMRAAALAAGLLLRLWFVWRYGHVTDDSLMYGDLAQNLLKHHVYGVTDTVDGVAVPRPTLIRLPGYPLFLALCFSIFGMAKYTAVMLVQVVLDLWTCGLLAGVAGRVFDGRAGATALWLGVLCPFTANYTAAALTETPTLFCIAFAFYALVRWREEFRRWNRWLGVLGFALAWAILLRPEQGMLAAVVVPAMLWMGWKRDGGGGWERVGPAVLVGLLTVLPLLPWTARNWHTMHVFEPLAPRGANDPGEFNPYGFQRWYRTWAIDFASTEQVYWMFDGQPIAVADLPDRAFDSNEQYTSTEAVLEHYNETTTATAEVDGRFAELARERVQADPLRYYVGLPLARVLNMTLRPRLDTLPMDLKWWKLRRHPAETILGGALGLLNLGYLALAGLEVRRRAHWGRWAPVLWALVATIAMRGLLLLNLDNSEPRYTLEFYPALIVLASGLLANWMWGRSAPAG